MMQNYPFNPERLIGITANVDGTIASIVLDSATKLPRSYFGERVTRGEVGEFVIFDLGGIGVFGRISQAGTKSITTENSSEEYRPLSSTAHAQLLATIHLDGHSIRGVSRYPKIGDPVYAASLEVIKSVLNSEPPGTSTAITLGELSADDSIPVNVPLSKVFGRHLSIVGSTGSGKSWTLANLCENVYSLNGKMILIDATGEFHTLGDKARHVAFGSTLGEPSETELVSVPHYMMRETDRNAFLNPSSGVQLPKLREAIRSLRLANALQQAEQPDPTHFNLLDDHGAITKAGAAIRVVGSALKTYQSQVDDPHYPFNLDLLAWQIQRECIWPVDRDNPKVFGKQDMNQIGYVNTLVSRINDLLHSSEIMDIIDPSLERRNLLDLIDEWIADPDSSVMRISLRNLTFSNHLREIIVNILGQKLLSSARQGKFHEAPLLVAVDEAHQFFNVTLGDQFASTELNAFDSIAKEGRKYGLTVCIVTQRPRDLPAGILSQVGMSIVHRLSDGRDRQSIEDSAAELDHSATKLLPGLVPGEAILMGVDFPVPISVHMRIPECKPSSDGPNYENWGSLP